MYRCNACGAVFYGSLPSEGFSFRHKRQDVPAWAFMADRFNPDLTCTARNFSPLVINE